MENIRNYLKRINSVLIPYQRLYYTYIKKVRLNFYIFIIRSLRHNFSATSDSIFIILVLLKFFHKESDISFIVVTLAKKIFKFKILLINKSLVK